MFPGQFRSWRSYFTFLGMQYAIYAFSDPWQGKHTHVPLKRPPTSTPHMQREKQHYRWGAREARAPSVLVLARAKRVNLCVCCVDVGVLLCGTCVCVCVCVCVLALPWVRKSIDSILRKYDFQRKLAREDELAKPGGGGGPPPGYFRMCW